MYQTLIPCPGCSRHIRAIESACPFCAATLSQSFSERAAPDTRSRLTRKATVLFGVAALAMSGCAAAIGPDGGEMRPDVPAADAPVAQDAIGTDSSDVMQSIVDTGPPDNGGAMNLYGAPPPQDAGFADAGPGPDDGGSIGLLYGAPIDPVDGR